jgi:spermidine/putrescine-binding protein
MNADERKEVEQLVHDLASGKVSRREFVSRTTALGLGMSTIGLALAACGKKDAPPADGAAAGSADLGEMEKELNIYAWSDYIAEDTVPNFEKEFGVKVTYDTYESNEEMVAKLHAGASGYDIVLPSNYTVPVMIATNLATPLSKQYLTNLKNLAPTFINPVFDPDNKYSVAYQWGTTGIAYRTDKVPDPGDSWGIFLDPKYKGKMTQMDDQRDVIGSWLRYRGHSLNSVDPAELAGAKADAIAAKKNLKAYISAPVKGQLVSGDVWIAQLWNGDTAQAKVEQPNIAYMLPKEGCTIWTDSMVVPRTAPHKRAAHEWINYVLRPDVAANISNFTGYGTPNAIGLPMMTTPVPYPTAEEFQRLEYQKDLGEHNQMWDQLWTEIKSA